MAPLRIGTCSWKYNSWRGLVYSHDQNINYLKEYALQYSTVEIDQWFWSLFGVDKIRLPSHVTVEEYRRSVGDNFKFSVKIPNSITLTHFYRKSKTDPLVVNPHFLNTELFEHFLDTIHPMGSKLGPLMFQFEYLNKKKMAAQKVFQEKFGNFINNIQRTYPLLVEIRNPNYLNPDYFSFLKKHQLGHVFLQGYYMPPVWKVYAEFKDFIGSPTVIRLHGPDRSNMEKASKGIWNRILEPRDEELTGIAQMIRDLVDRQIEVYVNVNNHYEGSAPLSIKRLNKILNSMEE